MNLKFLLSIFLTMAFVFSHLTEVSAQHKATWKLFSNVSFEDVFIEEYESYASLLVYDDKMKELDGQEITITGYYIPVEENVLIISRFPNASCFFCGNAGMESVMEVRPSSPSRTTYITDQLLTFKGTLKINSNQWEYVSFILEDADLLSIK